MAQFPTKLSSIREQRTSQTTALLNLLQVKCAIAKSELLYEKRHNILLVLGSTTSSGVSPDCFTITKDPSTGAFSLQRTLCNFKAFFICQMCKSDDLKWIEIVIRVIFFWIGQSLAQGLQQYLPSPVAVLPLSQSAGPNDVGPLKLSTTQEAIAYDTLYSPAGFLGSAMFTKELNHMSYVSVNTTTGMAIQTSLQMTLMGWIRTDNTFGGTFLVAKQNL